MDVTELIKSWLKGYAENTKETYFRIITEFFTVINNWELIDISQGSIERYLDSIESQSVNTKHIKIETLRSFFSHIHKNNCSRINFAVMLERQKQDKTNKAYVDFDEFSELLTLAKNSNQKEYKIILSMYLNELKVSIVAKKHSKSRQTINSMLRKYHPIVTPEMIKNSLKHHSKQLALMRLDISEKELEVE